MHFVGTKFDIFNAQKNNVVYTSAKWHIHWKLKPHNGALNMKVTIIWPDAIELVTQSLENPLKLMHTPNILRFLLIFIFSINNNNLIIIFTLIIT